MKSIIRPSLQENASNSVGVLLILCLATFPLFIFGSGGFQIVDILIILLFMVILCTLSKIELEKDLRLIVPFLPFLLWVIAQNTYFIMSSGHVASYLLAGIQIVYGFVIMTLFHIVFNRLIHSRYGEFYILSSIVLTCMTPWFLTKDRLEGSSRYALSLNNPNQLGYHGILVLSMLFLTCLIFKRFKPVRNSYSLWYITAGFLSANVFVYLSASRAAILSIIPLDIVFMCFIFKRLFAFFFFFSIGIIVIIFNCGSLSLHHYSSLEHFVRGPVDRIQSKSLVDVGDLSHRTVLMSNIGYDYGLLFGYGVPTYLDGNLRSVDNMGKDEVHNGFLGVLSSYGLIGIALFTFSIIMYVATISNVWNWYTILLPIVIYNMSHYGLRFRMFWIVLALLGSASLAASSKLPNRFDKQYSIFTPN